MTLRVGIGTPEQARETCANLLADLPDWFGRPSATAHYIENVANHRTYLAWDGDAATGLLALKPLTDHAAEVWLMAVAPKQHRMGLGTRLLAAAIDDARAAGRQHLVLRTMSDDCPDPYYAKTRAFYTAAGFTPLIPYQDAGMSMIWMLKELG